MFLSRGYVILYPNKNYMTINKTKEFIFKPNDWKKLSFEEKIKITEQLIEKQKKEK